ncbi:MAG TPA: Gfo/Idh/MocA family oxidoreductase [Candidatus Acidoferrales bacterium]|nr:Gfo/Idh/MocA family oxidoreductase [Candidatus Acidoferrales bacterium]
MQKISWGILSTSKFAARATIPAMQKSKYSQVTAIASRDINRAKSAGAQLGISKVLGSYEALLSDPSIDAIYIPLPNHMHVEWTLKALKTGKHVLCEKPIGLNYVDARRLQGAAKDYPNLKVMEAFMYRHHPQWKKVKELVDEKAIGETKAVHSLYSYYNDDESNIRNIMEVGGGVMLDIGCYCTSLSRYVFDREPRRVLGRVEHDPKTKIDRLASGLLDFETGISTFTCGTQLQPYQRVNIAGTKGRIEIEIPFNAPNDRPCRIWLQRGTAVEEILFDVCDQYTIQADLFAQAIITNGDVPTPLDDGIANMRVIDAIGESSQKGSWVSL